eukprot:8563538-Pyramimonas_sp.AAC.1
MHGRGVVRSAQENASLRARRDSRDAAAAESIKKAKAGAEVVRLAERRLADRRGAAVAASG